MTTIAQHNSATPATPPVPVNRLGAIDGLRALAILMVYVYHVWVGGGAPALDLSLAGWNIALHPMINGFPAGVDLFMVLSGFCLFWPIAKNPALATSWSASDFAWKRIWRIVPPYYAAIIFVTILPNLLVIFFRALGQPAKWQSLPDAWQYITHLLFIHSLFPSTWSGIQGAFWSLGLEAQFYAVFPLVVLGFRKMGMRVVIVMVALSFVYRLIAGHLVRDADWDTQLVASIFFLGRWMQFGAGMVAAWIVARGLPTLWRSSWAGAVLLGLALAGYCASLIYPAAFSPFRDLGLALAFTVGIVALCATESPVRALFENRVVRWFGFISYSFFLVHQNSVFYLGELLKKVLHLGEVPRFFFQITIGLVLMTALSAVFFHFCERPFLGRPPMSRAQLRRGDAPLPTANVPAA